MFIAELSEPDFDRYDLSSLRTGIMATNRQGELDFLDAFAGEIPARIIAQILGLPESEMRRFRKLVYSVTRAFKMGFDQSQRAEIERDIDLLLARSTACSTNAKTSRALIS